MKVLETRRRDGMKWRRYRTDDGRTITTYELPAPVLRSIAPQWKVQERLAAWERGEKTRARRALIVQRIAEGVKPLAIAAEVGMTDRAVQRIKSQLEERE